MCCVMIGAIIGGIAEAYYGVSDELRKQALRYLDEELKEIISAFEERYGVKKSVSK